MPGLKRLNCCPWPALPEKLETVYLNQRHIDSELVTNKRAYLQRRDRETGKDCNRVMCFYLEAEYLLESNPFTKFIAEESLAFCEITNKKKRKSSER